MLARLLPLLLLVLPFAEIAAFIFVGSRIGVLSTLGLVVLSVIAGALLLRVQGLGAMRRMQMATERGEVPARELVHGMMIALAGLLLIVPGFLTDIVGLLLFIPPVRDAVWSMIRSRITIVTRTFGGRPRPDDGRVIDLDAEDYRRTDRDRIGPR